MENDERLPDELIDERYRRIPGQWLSKFEIRYFWVGFAIIFITPVQFMLMIQLAYTDLDWMAFNPGIFLLSFLVPPFIVRAIVMRIVAGDSELCIDMMHTLGVTIIPFFTFHQGIMMMSRIIFIYIVRRIKNDRHWRSNSPYILLDAEW